ncbi:helix-turn-helix domain-containing protein [Actinokineospora sp. 24-640]
MSRDPSRANHVVRQWQLVEILRELRAKSGLTMEQAAERLKPLGGTWSKAKISRIEGRESGVKSADAARMLDVYGVTDATERAWVLELATKPAERGYWHSIRPDLPEDFHLLLNVEAALLSERQLATLVVPGLLQTPEYARAVISGSCPGISQDVVERRVLARTARQRVLAGPDPMRYHVILEETMLTRTIGGPETMFGQLTKLRTAAKAENITIQVLPKDCGATPMIYGPFSLLTLPDPIPDFGYTEGPGGAVYIEDKAKVRTCTERWGILTRFALPPDESMRLINEAGKTYE